MTDQTPFIRKLHAQYCSCSGQFVALTMTRIMSWENWLAYGNTVGGWGESDIEAVIYFLKRLIKEGRKWPQSLWFKNLIQNTDNFEELHSAARAWKREPRFDFDKQRVLKATGRATKPEPQQAKPVGDIVAGMAALKAFQDLKNSL